MKWLLVVVFAFACADRTNEPELVARAERSGTPTSERWWEDGKTACDRIRRGSDLASRHLSPDAKYEILLCRSSRFWGMPGQGSDAPGALALIHTHDGAILRTSDLEMVQRMEPPTWRSRVAVSMVLDWALPYPVETMFAAQPMADRSIYYEDGAIGQILRSDGSFYRPDDK